MVRSIPLTKGYVALIDDEDYDIVSQWKWTALVSAKTVYACRRQWVEGKKKIIYLHRQVMGIDDSRRIDHIDRDGLNNQKSNLRYATHTQNMNNKGPLSNGVSAYKGVSPRGDKWRASICRDKKKIMLGTFASEDEAARAYDKAARELHGEFAYINFPDE